MIAYERPKSWILYDPAAIAADLAEAKAAALSLQTMPYRKAWVESLQRMELKREVAGTSRIEGADFTDRELEAVINEAPEAIQTRSQRQAFAALQAYKWIGTVEQDRPITVDLILDIHRLIVSGADDDHCPPGQLRKRDENVNFGSPRHRGVEGGDECRRALDDFARALREEYQGHDPLIRAIAAHYHFAAMHPFLDGNGRTARALEALLLQRSGLRDSCFVAMSNYYYDEKSAYLGALARVRANGHDLTPFLSFALRGVALQVRRLLTEIQREMRKALFRNTMYDLFNLLHSPKKRVLAKRQLAILHLLLDSDAPVALQRIMHETRDQYGGLRKRMSAVARDLNNLLHLGAISYRSPRTPQESYLFEVRLEWPTEITEGDFFQKLQQLPSGKTYSFLQSRSGSRSRAKGPPSPPDAPPRED